jgi:hypothetical protein
MQGGLSIVNGFAYPGQLTVYVRTVEGAGHVIFPTDGEGVSSDGSYALVAGCPDTTDSISRVRAMRSSNDDVHYAFTCYASDGGPTGLYVGQSSGSTELVSESVDNDNFYDYVYSGGNHLVLFGKEASQGSYAFGPDVASLKNSFPLADRGYASPWSAVVGPDDGSFTLFEVGSGGGGPLFPLTLRSATLSASRLPDLATSFDDIGLFTGPSDTFYFNIPSLSSDSILAAGSILDRDQGGTRVLMAAFSRGGLPRVFGSEVTASAGTETFRAAGAAFFDPPLALVAWTQLDGTDHSVWGRYVECQ